MVVRAIRGAVSVRANEESQILAETRLMLSEALEKNNIAAKEIVSIVFVVTQDLDKAFPARAAREIGLLDVPLLDMVSPAVSGSMPRVIRMLLTFNTDIDQSALQHVYLGEAQRLRPDLVSKAQPAHLNQEEK